MSHSLGLTNATNARDLGGLPTTDGRTVRRGQLFRSNALNRLSDDDLVILGKLGLACLIDFRHDREVVMVGVDRLPQRPPKQVVSLPLVGLENDLFTQVSLAATGQGSLEVVERLHEEHPSGGAPAAMRELYRWFVSAPGARQAYGTALRLVADPEAMPLLFHCTAGKDRTGWLAALVLSALGVDRETVMADYLRTNVLNADTNTFVLGRAAGRIPDPTVLLPLLDARREYLEQSFDEVDTVWGGFDSYLRDALDLDAATLATLRTLHLE